MIELAAILVCIVIGIPLALFAIWLAVCACYGVIVAVFYVLTAPIRWLEWLLKPHPKKEGK